MGSGEITGCLFAWMAEAACSRAIEREAVSDVVARERKPPGWAGVEARHA